MTKHLADQPRTQGGARLREFLRQDRTATVHPAIHSLHRQPKTRDDASRKTGEYARIERGRTT